MDWASRKHPLPTENMKSNMKTMNRRGQTGRHPVPTESNVKMMNRRRHTTRIQGREMTKDMQ